MSNKSINKKKRPFVFEDVPFGSNPYDYDDDVLEIYGNDNAKFDKELKDMLSKLPKKVKKK